METCLARRPPCLLSPAAPNPTILHRDSSWSRSSSVRISCSRQTEFRRARTCSRSFASPWRASFSYLGRDFQTQRPVVLLGAGREGDFAAAVEKQEDSQVVEDEAVEESQLVEDGTDSAPKPNGVEELYEKLGIEKDGNLRGGLPSEFLELMKDEGSPPSYWVLGIGLVLVILARKIIWAELQRWAKLAAVLALGALDLVIYGLAKLIGLGGEPLASVVAAVVVGLLAIRNVFEFIAGLVSPGPVLLSVSLATAVLLVGESVSDTYGQSQKGFPSRKTLDTAGFLGLGGLIGLVPGEIVLLGLAAITIFLLAAKKLNPAAAFTPAVGVMAAVSIPVVRYPVLLAFAGPCLFRYWKLGYFSQGAVPKERTVEYPLVLKGLLYLAAVSFASRVTFSIGRYIQAGIAVARAT